MCGAYLSTGTNLLCHGAELKKLVIKLCPQARNPPPALQPSNPKADLSRNFWQKKYSAPMFYWMFLNVFQTYCFNWSIIIWFVRLSNHCSSFQITTRMQRFLWFIYFCRRFTCFRRFLRPSSGAHNCTYIFRYCQPILLLAATVEENSVPSRPRYQLVAVLVDDTWSCMYSYVLLMMGGGTAWNM